MTTIDVTPKPLLNRAMVAVTSAQFLSAFGDSALFFATLGVLIQKAYPLWSHSTLQMLFIVAYVVLAPFVGQIADSFSKGRVMMVANGIKLLGAAIIIGGLDPFFGYTLVGIGATAYSPAKYGILGEITHGDQLVKANGLIESSTLAAILVGSLAGGWLVDISPYLALAVCCGVYAGAVVANCFIPRLQAARPGMRWNLKEMVVRFADSAKILWNDQGTRMSLVGTSLFWGAGITLRFLLILWVPIALHIEGLLTPTLLNAMVAVGIVIGAAAAAKWITLDTVNRCIPAGVLLGVGVVVFVLQGSLPLSYAILMVIGIFGGFFIVPLNTLLQHRGKQTVGAGNAVAVQNFGENTAMLLMLGLYTLAVKVDMPVVAIGCVFGGLMVVSIGGLWLVQLRRQRG
ncbi:lysophospholipid transporter LplT [Limnobaculum zhutongyuii]|uniref:Lysophospholipid transporter LplT n=1 Tax=Limnobaculum zhutongyuii TaxID=2498113 RepID=A0A411WHB0_9GAMM|nr:lysophospholipid transporter LplT [Limnobaculum zhutongyuii]QBH95599.1 lysophospholipid transporter LplT [Limnobaculum zhutongyuii]TQS88710.1 lysophospholipid transporter LplT [Limnobaculum zhutongyuii]